MSSKNCPKCGGINSMYGFQCYTEAREIITGHSCIYCGYMIEELVTPKPERKPEPKPPKAATEKPKNPDTVPCPVECGGVIRPSQNKIGVCTGCFQHVQNFLRSKTSPAKLNVPVELLKGNLRERVEAKLRQREAA